MSAERARLTAQQDAIVRALISDGPIPDGFDPQAIERARRLLADKRAWVAAQRASRPQPAPTPRWRRWLGLG